VTEWISGVNIPSCQLMIGMGAPLHRLPDIRRLFGKDPWGTSTIDFDKDPQIAPSGADPDMPYYAHFPVADTVSTQAAMLEHYLIILMLAAPQTCRSS